MASENPDMTNKMETLKEEARLADQAERYEHMVEKMTERAKIPVEFSSEERNLFSVAFKNVVGSRRSAWRIISNVKSRETDEQKQSIAEGYAEKIRDEIDDLCKEVVDLIDNHLLKSAKEEDCESKVFYLKMKGDYYRYVAEVQDGAKKKEYATKAGGAYDEAHEQCKKHLKKPHPIRLGLALNHSVFYYEIECEHEKACNIAKEALDEATNSEEDLDQDCYKDSKLIMSLLRDNLTLWEPGNQDDLPEVHA